MRLRYTPRALAELDEVLAYIAERSPQGAQRVQSRIQSAIGNLADFPQAGKRTADGQLRRIVAAPYPYFVFYEIKGEEVVVIGVRHAARDPVTMPGAKDPDR